MSINPIVCPGIHHCLRINIALLSGDDTIGRLQSINELLIIQQPTSFCSADHSPLSKSQVKVCPSTVTIQLPHHTLNFIVSPWISKKGVPSYFLQSSRLFGSVISTLYLDCRRAFTRSSLSVSFCSIT